MKHDVVVRRVFRALVVIAAELLVAGFDDPAVGHDMDKIRDNVVKQALVMGYHDGGAFGRAQSVNTVGDNPKRVDIQA